jgi:glutathione S-transferase
MLKFYFHPLASFCWKPLIAFYENDTPFEPHIVDFGDETSRAEFLNLWPMGKMPVLRDEARGRTVPESTIVIEYLAQHHPGRVALVPSDPDLARQARLTDRFYDLYVHEPMQKIVGDRLRPSGKNDPHGVEAAQAQLRTAYGMIEQDMAAKTWAMGDTFTMADCAAAPALFYANIVVPFDPGQKALSGYLGRLMARPSFKRVLKEAEPYFKFYPFESDLRALYPDLHG